MLCVLSNVVFYFLAIAVLGLGFACFPFHSKTAGSTTLGAFLVQFIIQPLFRRDIRFPVFDTLFNLVTFRSIDVEMGSPFQQLNMVLFCWLFISNLAGPLFQWYVMTPQLQALTWAVDKIGTAIGGSSCFRSLMKVYRAMEHAVLDAVMTSCRLWAGGRGGGSSKLGQGGKTSNAMGEESPLMRDIPMGVPVRSPLNEEAPTTISTAEMLKAGPQSPSSSC